MRLTKSDRDKLGESKFAIPEARAYPIEDKEHAEKAVQLAGRHPEWEARIKDAVHRKFPGIKISHIPGAKKKKKT